MKNEDKADYKTWMHQIKEELALLDADAVFLVGHSVGASILIKFLTESKIEKTLAGVFLIASPYWGKNGWTYEGYEALVLPTEIDSKLPNDVPLFLYQSLDDEVVPFAHLALYANRFPQARVRELNGGGHQLNNDVSQVAEDIRLL